MKKRILAMFLLGSCLVHAQEKEQSTISAIYSNALTSYDAYENLRELCTNAPGRLVGSPASDRAIQILKAQVEKLNPDTCFLQTYNTSSWQCKKPAQATAQYGSTKLALNVVNLGLSVSTPENGLQAPIIEVASFRALDSLGTKAVKDKIVFFNTPMDNSKVRTFSAYGDAVDIRFSGASKASEYGAVGVLVRSISTEPNDFPHTGVSKFEKGVKEIPNLSISTNDADKLSELNKIHKDLQIRMTSNTETIGFVKTANIQAEIRGSVHPERIILIGAHIDSWFNTPGAHDDGAGCVQMIDVFRIFKTLNLHPVNTIRLVLFMDEEMYQSGSKVYSATAGAEKKEHIACIESDAGGLLPTGFGIDCDNENLVQSIKKQTAKLADFGIYVTDKSHAGVDIEPLKAYGYPLIGLSTNSQRYFEYHHSANDTFNQVSRREMQLGTAAIASLVYLIDRNGL
jgi:carboxypeptidase Q